MSETKLNETFPNKKYKIKGYKSFREVRKKCRGGNFKVDSNFFGVETISLGFFVKNSLDMVMCWL